MRKVLPLALTGSLALTGLLALSACRFAGHDDPADKARSLNTMAALPLHAYLPEPASDGAKVIGRAQWILGKQCMIRLGFTGFAALDTRSVESAYPVRQGTITEDDDMPGDDTPYGVVDPGLAAEHGYHNRTPETSGQPQEWPADQYTALTGSFEPGDSHVTHGHRIPGGGCLGQAMRKIYGAPPQAMKVGGVRLSGYYSLALELWHDSRERASKDQAWKKADRAWSACMQKQGFHYADPDKASFDSRWFGHKEPSEKERKTASADARCKLDTGYVPAVHSLEARTQNAAIARHEQRLDALRTADERAMRKARTINAHPPR